MDRPLSSDRRDYSHSNDRPSNYYGPSRGRGRHHRGGGRHHHRGGGRHHHHRRPRGNRFHADDDATERHDPKVAAVRQLLQLLNQVGALAPNTTTTTVASNIQAFTKVLVASPALFLHASPDSLRVEERAGPLAAGIVHCQAVWPLQTPCYAALTLALVDENIPQRTVEYAMRLFCRDLDCILLSSTATSFDKDEHHAAMVRLRLTLRFLFLLAETGVVQGWNDTVDGMDQVGVLAATHQNAVSVAGLVASLVQAAVLLVSKSQALTVALADTVWSVVPYLREIVTQEWIERQVIQPIQEEMTAYLSKFEPGTGPLAVLLKAERQEEGGEEDDDDEEEDDEDEEEESDGSGQVCDTFQDLMRTVQHLLEGDNKIPSRFRLFSDKPWKELKNGNDEPLTYTGSAPLTLSIFPDCKSLTMLLGGAQESSSLVLNKSLDLQGIVFGRLPIFGPPPDNAEEDDDEEMPEEETAAANLSLETYRTKFGLVDRFFLGAAVRDILISHESFVTEKGVERGSIRHVAEQLWSLRLVHGDSNNHDGMEYVILENLFSLITQCGRGAKFRLLYLSHVVLELTRVAPSVMSPAIAAGVSTLFQDYVPALAPLASYNLSKWFAFHLTNTDYQWPASYWKHWEELVLQYEWKNSRAAFVKSTLALMVENVSSPERLVKDCLPLGSGLVDHLVARDNLAGDENETLSVLASELSARIFSNNEGPESIVAYLTSGEIDERLLGIVCARTKALAKALLSPAADCYRSIAAAVEQAKNQSDDNMDESMDDAPDVLVLLEEQLEGFKSALSEAMTKDMIPDSDDEDTAELVLLAEIASATSFSRGLLEGCIAALLKADLVSSLSVIKWSLGEGTKSGAPCLRWWEIVSATINKGLSTIQSAKEQDSMAVDGEEKGSKIDAYLNYSDVLLSHVVQRVNTKLLATQPNKTATKLTTEQIEYVEGLKYVAFECQRAVVDKTTGLSRNEALEALSESVISGTRLASLIDADSKTGSATLQRSLESLD